MRRFKVGDRVVVISLDFGGRGCIPDECLGEMGTIVSFLDIKEYAYRILMDSQIKYLGTKEEYVRGWSFPDRAVERFKKSVFYRKGIQNKKRPMGL